MKKIGLFLFFTTPFLFVFSQDWKIEVARDNFFIIEEVFSQNKKNQLTIEVFNDDKSYFLSKSFSGKTNVRFPEDFNLKKGDSTFLIKEKFSLLFYINRQKISSTIEYTYVPNPKGFFQLSPLIKPIDFSINNKEEIIDQYGWIDSLGQNYFLRTQLTTNKTKYIYFYHFVFTNQTLILQTKMSDKSTPNSVNHEIQSIQITDLNENNIAEISCAYFIDDICKIVLTTDKKKYYIRKNKKNKISIGTNLKNEGEFMRFLINKIETNNQQ
ncbi:MAG: hypothetical protein CL853_02615 [Crocinitomicaceae bacterium]|nr:hypothetical protein [Crocinitomicaceae bacterium]|tara:strand:- start:588 stop:1394 length:807 start_codon:yes stop_codon:yes gene_type:complete